MWSAGSIEGYEQAIVSPLSARLVDQSGLLLLRAEAVSATPLLPSAGWLRPASAADAAWDRESASALSEPLLGCAVASGALPCALLVRWSVTESAAATAAAAAASLTDEVALRHDKDAGEPMKLTQQSFSDGYALHRRIGALINA